MRIPKMKTITRRSTKHYTKGAWNAALARNKWDNINESDNIEEMTAQLNSMVTKTLDECVPLKTFKVREQHKFGLSEKTKQSMKERDSLRQSKSNLSPSEKAVQHEKYKKMRNRVNSMIKADVIRYNEERITKAEDVNEVWKVVSDIAAPRSEARLTLM